MFLFSLTLLILARKYQSVFSFPYFNIVQSKIMDTVSESMYSSPHSNGSLVQAAFSKLTFDTLVINVVYRSSREVSYIPPHTANNINITL